MLNELRKHNFWTRMDKETFYQGVNNLIQYHTGLDMRQFNRKYGHINWRQYRKRGWDCPAAVHYVLQNLCLEDAPEEEVLFVWI